MSIRLAQSDPSRRLSSPKPRRPTMLDDLAAEYNRRRAKRSLMAVWVDLAGVIRELSSAPPKYRKDAGNPRPTVRPRYRDAAEKVEPMVEDFRVVSLPTGVGAS